MIIAISNSIVSINSGGKNAKAKKIANTFETRVLLDSGTFEAKSCLVIQIQKLI